MLTCMPASGNLITTVAGLATRQQLGEEAYGRINGLGAQLRSVLQEAFHEMGIAGHVTGEGSLLNAHLVREEPQTTGARLLPMSW